MTGPLLHVYRLPDGKAVEFEASLQAATGETPLRCEIRDRAALLALLQKHESDGIWERGRFVSLSAPEIVERCCALPNASSGPVTVSVHRP